MALEDKLDALIAAVTKNTEALQGASKATAGGKPTTAATSAVKLTLDDVKAVAGKVKAEKGADVAKAIIKEVGKATELAAVKSENYGKLVAAFELKLAEAAAPEVDNDEL